MTTTRRHGKLAVMIVSPKFEFWKAVRQTFWEELQDPMTPVRALICLLIGVHVALAVKHPELFVLLRP